MFSHVTKEQQRLLPVNGFKEYVEIPFDSVKHLTRFYENVRADQLLGFLKTTNEPARKHRNLEPLRSFVGVLINYEDGTPKFYFGISPKTSIPPLIQRERAKGRVEQDALLIYYKYIISGDRLIDPFDRFFKFREDDLRSYKIRFSRGGFYHDRDAKLRMVKDLLAKGYTLSGQDLEGLDIEAKETSPLTFPFLR